LRQVRVLFEPEAEKAYKELARVVAEEKSKGIANSDNQRLLKSIDNKVERLKLDPTAGDQLPARLFPKEYVEKYEINNLWKIDLVDFWRMLYTLRGDRVEVVCLVLGYMPHPKYDKKFGYRKK
jgi:hypothetical protein